MTGGMVKYWIIPRVGGQGTASCRSLTGLLQSPHFLCSYILKRQSRIMMKEQQRRKQSFFGE